MKFLLLTLLLTVGANSAYAITCNSVDSPNKLDIENHGFGKSKTERYFVKKRKRECRLLEC